MLMIFLGGQQIVTPEGQSSGVEAPCLEEMGMSVAAARTPATRCLCLGQKGAGMEPGSGNSNLSLPHTFHVTHFGEI